MLPSTSAFPLPARLSAPLSLPSSERVDAGRDDGLDELRELGRVEADGRGARGHDLGTQPARSEQNIKHGGAGDRRVEEVMSEKQWEPCGVGVVRYKYTCIYGQ